MALITKLLENNPYDWSDGRWMLWLYRFKLLYGENILQWDISMLITHEFTCLCTCSCVPNYVHMYVCVVRHLHVFFILQHVFILQMRVLNLTNTSTTPDVRMPLATRNGSVCLHTRVKLLNITKLMHFINHNSSLCWLILLCETLKTVKKQLGFLKILTCLLFYLHLWIGYVFECHQLTNFFESFHVHAYCKATDVIFQ